MVEIADSGNRLPDMFLELTSAEPDATAVICGERRLTRRDLAVHAGEVAVRLRGLGIGPDDRVGLFVEPSLALMTAVWGTLFAGAAYLPLSPEYPRDRLRHMITDSETKVIAATAALADRLADLAPPGTTILRLAEPGPETVPGPIGDLSYPAAGELLPGHLAYVIYTSGSTGRPKGVMLEHRGITSQLRWLRDAYGIAGGARVLQKTPMSFDAAQWEILAPACGATAVMGPPNVYRDPELLIETVTEHRVTVLQCVPTLLNALLDTEVLDRCDSLEQVFCGGEALTTELARQCTATLPGARLVNLYGPTECTINASAHTVDPARLGDTPGTVPIGTPVAGTRLHILDADLNPADTGELWISGVQLARGYLGRPDLTAERFITLPGADDPAHARLYRSGDLAAWNPDGTARFLGRADNQVKLRGYRVELDEIRLPIEAHRWVRHAAVVVDDDARTGAQTLLTFVELDQKEAALMDQGNHGAHHQSKESRLQVRAQLAELGFRGPEQIAGRTRVALPGKASTPEQRARVFARKTYRFFEGGDTTRADLLALLDREAPTGTSRELSDVDLAGLGGLLRWFGQYLSGERLLPKYGYASPGSLYATQLYLDLEGVAGLDAGCYYYHPVHHELVLIRPRAATGRTAARLHFLGRRSAIEPVYANNIREVLEIETGHMLGLFDEVLPAAGLSVLDGEYRPAVKGDLDCADEDHYLGTFSLGPYRSAPPRDHLDVYVQAHGGRVADLPDGLYRHSPGELTRLGDDVVRSKDVIAINQQVYARSSFGVTVLSRTAPRWRRYIDLGRELQRLQLNDRSIGLMSSGYSSKSGNDLRSAVRITALLAELGLESGPSYFFLGGRVSAEQWHSEGMKEDLVHMKGPAEMIREDLARQLPDYMIPSRIIVLDRLPRTANDKIDVKALVALAPTVAIRAEHGAVPPRTGTEKRIAEIWAALLHYEDVSVHDDFFAAGGNSLTAVALVNRVNKEFGGGLPMQVVFDAPTVARLAEQVDRADGPRASRLIPLAAGKGGAPVYCWPGLGGYPMNLRTLAARLDLDRPFYGVQAYGVNDGERPFATVEEMAVRDVRMIKRRQPTGPYTLWGYSFGARVAFEAAHQIERAGDTVESLVLIAPGSPRVDAGPGGASRRIGYADPVFVTILYSVFAGEVTGPGVAECLRATRDEDSFVAYVHSRFGDLSPELIRRVVHVVTLTYTFEYTFAELNARTVSAPITVLKARGDDYSFIEGSRGYSLRPPTTVELEADHYSMLRDPGVGELVARLRGLPNTRKDRCVPHVNIKHFPIPLSEERQSELVAALTEAVTRAFECDEGVISIALEPVEQETWNERVYLPEIVGRRDLLRKQPNY